MVFSRVRYTQLLQYHDVSQFHVSNYLMHTQHDTVGLQSLLGLFTCANHKSISKILRHDSQSTTEIPQQKGCFSRERKTIEGKKVVRFPALGCSFVYPTQMKGSQL